MIRWSPLALVLSLLALPVTLARPLGRWPHLDQREVLGDAVGDIGFPLRVAGPHRR